MDMIIATCIVYEIRKNISHKVGYDNKVMQMLVYNSDCETLVKYEKRLVEYDNLLETIDDTLRRKTDVFDLIKKIRSSLNIYRIIGYLKLKMFKKTYVKFEINDTIKIDDHLYFFDTPPNILIIYNDIDNKKLPDIDFYHRSQISNLAKIYDTIPKQIFMPEKESQHARSNIITPLFKFNVSFDYAFRDYVYRHLHPMIIPMFMQELDHVNTYIDQINY